MSVKRSHVFQRGHGFFPWPLCAVTSSFTHLGADSDLGEDEESVIMPRAGVLLSVLAAIGFLM